MLFAVCSLLCVGIVAWWLLSVVVCRVLFAVCGLFNVGGCNMSFVSCCLLCGVAFDACCS